MVYHEYKANSYNGIPLGCHLQEMEKAFLYPGVCRFSTA